MSTPIPITINGEKLDVESGQTIMQVCRKAGIDIPVLCDFEGLSTVGACRLCLVEIEGTPKLLPACTTPVAPNQTIHTDSERLQKYRRMIIEMFFSERNHICSACVANNNCELQDMGYKVGMDHVRFPYLFQECHIDASHEKFVIDHDRCILCSRCVRVCDEVESAHTWDMMGRGYQSRIIADFNQPWGESTTCTSCGKCVEICPTGALWPNGVSQGSLEKKPGFISELIEKRGLKQ
jgi:bidirectional [NiFe] hydrogenase diaphorase subunit